MIAPKTKALNAERALLGSLIVDSSTLDDVGDCLQPNDFTVALHRQIYTAIKELYFKSVPIDLISVSDHLNSSLGVKDDRYFISLCEIVNSPFTPKNIKHYTEIVKHASTDRKILLAAQEIIVHINDQKQNSLDYAQQRFASITNESDSDVALAKDFISKVLISIDARQSNGGNIVGLATGFTDLDKITHGLNGGDLIILAGRPGMGKTLLSTNIAEHIAIDQKKPVIIFSLEMNKEQLLERTLSSLAKIEAEKIRLGKLNDAEWQKISTSVVQIEGAKLFIHDKTNVSVFDIRSKCRRIQREQGLALVIVDYITLMSGDGENETLRIGNISRGLKMLARDLNIPVIAISQLNRLVEQRIDKRPTMADLRQSGSIEQDADIILFIYRDEIYNENSPYKGLASLIVAKHRNGKTGTVTLNFNSQFCRFDNYFGESIPKPTNQTSRIRIPFTYNKGL